MWRVALRRGNLIEQDLRCLRFQNRNTQFRYFGMGGDIIASCWFFVERINQSGTKFVIRAPKFNERMLRIDDGGIVVFGKGGAGNAGNHISLILPDAVTQEDITSSKSDSVATELSIINTLECSQRMSHRQHLEEPH